MAAGKGVRMLPLTENIPKVLVEVNGKPFLSYVIENLKATGITEFGIIVGYKKEQIKEFLDKNKIQATLIEQKEQLGTGHAVMQAKEFCEDDNFIVLGGDNLWSPRDFKTMATENNTTYVATQEVEDPSKYGVLVTEGNKLKKIVEKPKEFISKLTNIGLYKFTPEIFEALDKIELSERGEYEITDAITILAEQGKVEVIKIKDYWLDLGCKEDIPKIEEFLNNLPDKD